MAKGKELITTFVELDGRRSQEMYYRLICNLGAGALALLASDEYETRAVPIPADRGNDAMAHPEFYLSTDQTIYGGYYEELIIDYVPPQETESETA
jgi:hypothetical protein